MTTRINQGQPAAVHEEAASVKASPLSADLARGAVGGLVAGAVFLGLNAWFANSMGEAADAPLLMMSTIVLGDGAMADGSASAGIGLAVHAVLSVAFGLVFALAAHQLTTNGSVALTGTVYGALLYLVNFELVAPSASPVFEMANHPFELVAHVVFGVLLSFAFFASVSRRHDPVLAWS